MYIATLPPAGELRTACALAGTARLLSAGEIVVAAQCDARRLEPVLDEGALQLQDDGSLDPDVGVAPLAFRPAIAAPLAARAGSPRDADPPVRHEDAAMIAVVGGVERERPERAERLDAAPRLGHDLALPGGHRHRADGVDQDIDLDAGPAALGQRARHVVGGLTFLEDVLGVVDRLRRVLDELELRREDLVAVQEDVDPIARHDGGLGIAGDRGGECRVADLEGRAESGAAARGRMRRRRSRPGSRLRPTRGD